MKCEDKIIDMINEFINCKKNIIKDINNKNKEENLQILDPVIQKQYGCSLNKWIKSVSKANSYYISIKIVQSIHLILTYMYMKCSNILSN